MAKFKSGGSTDTNANGQMAELRNRLDSLYAGGPSATNPTDALDVLYQDPNFTTGLEVYFAPGVGTNGLGRYAGNIMALGVEGIRAYFPSSYATVAHEIGHYFIGGEDHPACDNSWDGLMCAGGRTSHHIVGCERWKDNIELKEGDICASYGSCPDPLPDQCNAQSDREAQIRLDDTLCHKMRVKAGVLSPNANESATVTLLDTAGNDFPATSANFPLDIECGDLTVARRVESTSSDPFPAVSGAMSFWSVRYDSNDVPGLEPLDETLMLDGGLESITVDVDTYPLDELVLLGASVYDEQAKIAQGDSVLYFRRVGDKTPPEMSIPADVILPGCAASQAIQLEMPTVEEDNCGGSIVVSGQVVRLNGLALSQPEFVGPSGDVVFSQGGVYEIEWSAKDEAGNAAAVQVQRVTVSACAAAGLSLEVGNGASLRDAAGNPMALMVLEGNLHVGGLSEVGAVVAAGDVQIDGGSTVAGSVTAGGTITVQSGASAGPRLEHQDLQLPVAPSIKAHFPETCLGGVVQFWAGEGDVYLSPGCYSEITVGSRTRVHLGAGAYATRRLSLEPDSVFVADEPVGLLVKDALTYRGKSVTTQGAPNPLNIGYFGSSQANIEAPFTGTVLAPNATLTLGGNAGQIFKGRFYGRRLEVRAGLGVVTSGNEPGFEILIHRDFDVELEARQSDPGGCSLASTRPSQARSWSMLVICWIGGMLIVARKKRLRQA